MSEGRILPLRRPSSLPSPAALPPFADLLRDNLDALFRVAAHMTGVRAEAEDVVQEAAIRAFRGYATVRDGAAVRVWLFRVLRHAACDHLRARGRLPVLVDLTLESVVEDALAAPEPFTGMHERAALLAALARIEVAFREVVWLVDAEGMTVREGAEILELPQGTIASRLFRGRKKLREILREVGDDE